MNPWLYVQEGLQYLVYVSVCVCVYVCLSVHGYSGTTDHRVTYERYQWLQTA